MSQTNVRRGPRRRNRGYYPCPIQQEILAHARATNLMQGKDYWLPPVQTISHEGRRPHFRPSSFWGNYEIEDDVHELTHFELLADMMVDKPYPRYFAKDLIIWTDEFAFIREPGTMEVSP